MLLTRGSLIVCGVLAACGDPAAPACEVPGDVELGLVAATAAGELVDLAAGDDVPLTFAPQGGHILLVAPRIRDLAACTVDVTAALRDKTNDRVVGLEQRPIELTPRADGWAVPADPTSLAGLANLAVCPTSAASTPINDHVFQLEVSIDAGDGVARPMVALDVMPRCAVDDTYCACDCDPTGAACAAAR